MKIKIESFKLPRAGGQPSTTGVRHEPMCKLCGKQGTTAGIHQDTTLLCPKADTVTPPQSASQDLWTGKKPEMATHGPVSQEGSSGTWREGSVSAPHYDQSCSPLKQKKDHRCSDRGMDRACVSTLKNRRDKCWQTWLVGCRDFLAQTVKG